MRMRKSSAQRRARRESHVITTKSIFSNKSCEYIITALGDPFVTNKDEVSQPSSALRHCTELTNNIIHTHYSDHDNLSKPVLAVYSE